MKKIIFTCLLAMLAFAFTNAQTIEMQKVFGGYKYSQDGKPLSMKNLVTIMENNAEASVFIKKAKSNNTLASMIGAVGGALVGWPIGTAIGGGDPNWTLAAVGAGLIVVTIPIANGVNKNAKQAVNIYNADLSFLEKKYLPHFSLISKGTQVGFSMKF